MVYDFVQAVERAPGFAGRALRFGRSVVRSAKVLVERATEAVRTIDFFARHALGMNVVRMAIAVLVIAVPAGLVMGHTAQAVDFLTGFGSTIALLIANILQLIISFVGWLLVKMVAALIYVAQYNGFITSSAVVNGWVIVRDIVNMFFVISLLLMAFGIMLNVGKYASMDPGKEIVNLAVAAVLVNFSRTICGLLIDMSQVVMMTFVYGFKETAGKNFLDAFRVTAVLQNATAATFAGASTADDSGSMSIVLKTVMTFLLALVMTWIALGVVCIMTIMLAVRIVHLWVLVTISPIAFMPASVAKIEAIKSQWWEEFNKTLFFGPLMSFFLWLSLVSVSSGNIATAGFDKVVASSGEAEASAAGGGVVMSEAASDENIRAFIIAICLLVVGTSKAKEMSGAIGKTAGTIGDKLKKGSKATAKWAGQRASQVQIAAGKQQYDANGNVIGRERVQLGALGAAYGQKLTKTATFKKVKGIIKGPTDDQKEAQAIKALEATGQKAEADARKQKLFGKATKKLEEEGVNDIALPSAYEEERRKNPKSERFKMLSLKMAEAGKLPGGLAEMKRVADGDDVLLKMMMNGAKKAGDSLADVDMKDPDAARELIKSRYGDLGNKGDKNKFMRSAAGSVFNGPDGKMRNAAAVEALKAIDRKDFDDANGDTKRQVMEALVLAETKLTGAEQAEVTAKITYLGGTTAVGARSDIEMKAEEEKRLVKERGMLVGTGAVQTAFGGINTDTSMFDSRANRDVFDSFVKRNVDPTTGLDIGDAAKNAKLVAGQVQTDMLLENGSVNDLAVGILGNMKASDVDAVMRDKNIDRDKKFALIQAARNLADATQKSMEDMAAATTGKTAGDPDYDAALNKIEEAQKTAKSIQQETNNTNSTISAAMRNQSYSGEAFRFVRATTNDVVKTTLKTVVIAGTAAAGVATAGALPTTLVLGAGAVSTGAAIGAGMAAGKATNYVASKATEYYEKVEENIKKMRQANTGPSSASVTSVQLQARKDASDQMVKESGKARRRMTRNVRRKISRA